MRKILFAALILIAAGSAGAAEKHDPKCDSPMQQDLMNCSRDGFNAADKRLNVLYQKLVAEAKKSDKGDKDEDDEVGQYESNLRASQKAWVVFRDAECMRTSGSNHALYGQEGDLEFGGCLEELTKERIKQLSKTRER